MKSIQHIARKKHLGTAIAIAEGIWNGIVVSAVMTVSAYLIHTFWII